MYSPNNILFRIVSSSAIAQFRQDQAFDFNELINNPKYSFSSEARETLLLNYDLWFRFILHLEKVLIRNHSHEQLGPVVTHLDVFAHETINEIADIMKSHAAIFGIGTIQTSLVQKSIAVYYGLVLSIIAESKNDSMYVAYPKIVIAISNALNNLLFILHETENLKNNNFFLSYTDEVIALRELNKFPLIDRAKLYMENFGATEFVIKNYTSGKVDQKCLAPFEEAGIKITKINPDHL